VRNLRSERRERVASRDARRRRSLQILLTGCKVQRVQFNWGRSSAELKGESAGELEPQTGWCAHSTRSQLADLIASGTIFSLAPKPGGGGGGGGGGIASLNTTDTLHLFAKLLSIFICLHIDANPLTRKICEASAVVIV
jgi:hypothetical protein